MVLHDMYKKEWGGSGDKIIFLHANAHTPEVYSVVLRQLTAYGQVVTYRQRPLWEEARSVEFNSWYQLADDLIQQMESEGISGCVGIGHSMGAVALWLASIQRPELFAKLVLIEPVVLKAAIVRSIPIIPYWIKEKFVPIVKIAARRRDTWSDRQALRRYILSKRVFQAMDDRVLEDFLQYNFVSNAQGQITLAYPKDWEAMIYSTAPNLWKVIPQNKVECLIIKAANSDVITDESWDKIKQIVPRANFLEMQDVSHLLPMEVPDKLIERIAAFLQ